MALPRGVIYMPVDYLITPFHRTIRRFYKKRRKFRAKFISNIDWDGRRRDKKALDEIDLQTLGNCFQDERVY